MVVIQLRKSLDLLAVDHKLLPLTHIGRGIVSELSTWIYSVAKYLLTFSFWIGYSYYASGYSLTPEFYQTLVDRCWRRSGTLLYRPNQRSACCPHYTLRLDSAEFKPSKDQRQAVNRFNRFVTGDGYAKEAARRYPLTREQAKSRDTYFALVERIHEAEAAKLKTPPQPTHNLSVTLESDDFTEEKFAVFENYQRLVHKEDPTSISKKGFKRFLCNSPLQTGIHTDPSGRQRQVGSFHQCYRLDGKLVAVGVLDLLPEAVSAVYFMYDDSIHKHQPGKLGALREIALAMEGGYRYWYPGYYIHSCPKMRYKIDYSPQYVLDPETLKWDLLDKEALAIFDKKPYVSLSRERTLLQDQNGNNGNNTGTTQGSVLRNNSVPPANGDVGDGDDDTETDDSADAEAEDEDDDDDDEGSLFTSNMPGIPSLLDLDKIDLDHIRVLSDHTDDFFTTGETSVWALESIHQLGSLKSKIAELAAVLGPDMLDQIALDFRRSRREKP